MTPLQMHTPYSHPSKSIPSLVRDPVRAEMTRRWGTPLQGDVILSDHLWADCCCDSSCDLDATTSQRRGTRTQCRRGLVRADDETQWASTNHLPNTAKIQGRSRYRPSSRAAR